MARRKSKKNTLPAWSYKNNPSTNFGMITTDMLKSEEFLKLSSPLSRFLLICMVHAADPEAKACLKAHLLEDNLLTGSEENIAHYLDWKNGYFVFPAKQLKAYGYKQNYATKLFDGLIEAGFIRKVEKNNHRKKVNVYRFVSDWKNKMRITPSE